jgi:hypothetical protein
VVMRFGISVARRQIYHAVVESTNEEQTCYTDALIKTATSIQSSTRSTCCATAQTL